MTPGKIIGVFAAAGLVLIVAAFFLLKAAPPGARPETLPNYDQVFKYCMRVFDADDEAYADLRNDPLFPGIDALAAGAYRTNGGGQLYLLGSGMFELRLPSQLQVVRDLGRGMEFYSPTERPRSIIGCTTEQLVQALRAYGLELTKQEGRSS